MDEHWLETFEDPGVVPYPELGRLATDHLRPSTMEAFLTAAKANPPAEGAPPAPGEAEARPTFGESMGLARPAGPSMGLWLLEKNKKFAMQSDIRQKMLLRTFVTLAMWPT